MPNNENPQNMPPTREIEGQESPKHGNDATGKLMTRFNMPITDPWDDFVYLPTWMVDFYW